MLNMIKEHNCAADRGYDPGCICLKKEESGAGKCRRPKVKVKVLLTRNCFQRKY